MRTNVSPEEVQECVNKIIEVLNKQFPSNLDGAMTTVLYLFVRMLDVMNVPREEAMETLTAALDAQDMAKTLLGMETENQWLN